MFTRICKQCESIIYYRRINKFHLAERLGTLCTSCGAKYANNVKLEVKLKKQCPTCNKQLEYDRQNSYNRAIKNNSKCRSCSRLKKRKPYTLPNKKSGHGICGSYNGNHFRSSYELFYMMFLDRFKIQWKSAEKLPGIKYTDNERQRKYKADFIVAEKYLVEVKPKRLQSTEINLSKKAAAELFCAKNHLKYKITDIGSFTLKQMFNMHDEGIIKLPDVYVKKWISQKLC